MRFVVFWDYSSRYVLDTLERCVTHDVVGSVPLADDRIESLPEQIAAFKQTELDAFVVAVSRKSLVTEWILSYLRAFDMTQPVYIIKDHSVLSGYIPFMYRETFMDERVILLKQQGGDRAVYRAASNACVRRLQSKLQSLSQFFPVCWQKIA